DIDRFKRVNDDFGHAGGDAVLRAVGSALRASVRQSDFAARIGGEEFVVVLPDADAEGAGVVAGRVRLALSLVVLPDGRPLTASFGIAVVAPSDAGADSLMHRADEAMYLAKQAGRDRVMVADAPTIAIAPVGQEPSHP
ncbi:MAG: hypothetical protein QOH99_1623, partial [Frankiaceae bacterium]|nr:hypothetical protein [Frankiaceae bacterium]